jgi:hypothetical protein
MRLGAFHNDDSIDDKEEKEDGILSSQHNTFQRQRQHVFVCVGAGRCVYGQMAEVCTSIMYVRSRNIWCTMYVMQRWLAGYRQSVQARYICGCACNDYPVTTSYIFLSYQFFSTAMMSHLMIPRRYWRESPSPYDLRSAAQAPLGNAGLFCKRSVSHTIISYDPFFAWAISVSGCPFSNF